MNTFAKRVISLFILVLFMIIVFFLINYYILMKTRNDIIDEYSDLKKAQTAIVLGAMVYENKKISQIYYDRVYKGVELYKNGIVDKILVTGDHGRKEYDEVNAAKKYMLDLGVKEEDIFMDHAGFSTYESMYRAKEVFEVRSAIIVTQKFHLPRALFIAKSKGIVVQGYVADRHNYLLNNYNNFRESLARIKDFGFALIKPKPKYLGEKIPITGSGLATQD